MTSLPTPEKERVDFASLEQALKHVIEGEVRFDAVTRGMYSTDASVYQIVPAGVVIPRTSDDVIRTVDLCRRHGISVTARGGGTSQCGQSIGPGIQIDFSKYMRRILELDVEAGAVRVEPGIVLAELNQYLQPNGLELPLDLSTANRATIGGMVANNSSGTRSIVYGSTIDYVMELKVLLADGSVVTLGPLDPSELEARCRQEDLEGLCYRRVRELAGENADEIRKRFPKILRRVGGYNLDRFLPSFEPSDLSNEPFDLSLEPFDLSKLMVGSEGTLGLVLEAKLRLVQPPKAKVLAVAEFDHLRDAMVATPVILRHQPSAVELMDRNLLDMTRGKTEFEPLRDFIVGDPGAILIVEFMGDSMEGLPTRIDELEAELLGLGLTNHVHRATESLAQARIWKLRQAGLGLSLAETGDTKAISFVEDTAVAPDQLPEYIDRFQEILDRYETKAIFYAHASVGLLHIRPAIDMKSAGGIQRFQGIAEEVSKLVLEFGGALSAEHGDGLARSPFQEKMFGTPLYEAFCQVKEAFDKEGVFNPSKIVHPLPITDNLQYGTEYRTTTLETVFDFSDFEGMAGAVEQCGGVGACRKTVAGTMCPSYMATLDERDSTRGRANALRLAISGQLGPGGITNPALYPVLDLCLECKACKSECPTGVDMARLKSEFLDQYHGRHGAPLRSRVLASAEKAALWGSRLAPLSNWVLGSAPVRWANEILLGIDGRRRIPSATRRTFTSWWEGEKRGPSLRSGDGSREAGPEAGREGGSPRRNPTEAPAPGPRIALFADTFTNHYEPRQGMAAVRFAEKLGVRVEVPPRVCCGRPQISKGFLKAARRQAELTARTLFPLARAGLPIVFCEPGCYSAVRDDHPHLLRGDLKEMAQEVSAACLTFEEWAESILTTSDRDGSATGTRLDFAHGPARILLHAHCHQKALGGLSPAMKLLNRIPGSQVTEADAGCCGMAGSFGYEKEHYAISKAVGERKLLPAVRASGPDTVVVAPGFSCRQQIRHFTGTEAVSAMELMERLVQ
ncbi:MAG: FAD-linked oxidase C-terminal domain-containing protein [Gemmatimonadota bacterium]